MIEELFKLSEMEAPCIRAISLWQPWASWIAWGWKTIETRGHDRFRNLEGHRIAIHASKQWDDECYVAAGRFLTPEQFENTLDKRPLPAGAIVCTAIVAEFIPLDASHSQRALADQSSGKRFGLVLTDIETCRPIPERGRQGIWRIPLSVFQ